MVYRSIVLLSVVVFTEVVAEVGDVTGDDVVVGVDAVFDADIPNAALTEETGSVEEVVVLVVAIGVIFGWVFVIFVVDVVFVEKVVGLAVVVGITVVGVVVEWVVVESITILVVIVAVIVDDAFVAFVGVVVDSVDVTGSRVVDETDVFCAFVVVTYSTTKIS